MKKNKDVAGGFKPNSPFLISIQNDIGLVKNFYTQFFFENDKNIFIYTQKTLSLTNTYHKKFLRIIKDSNFKDILEIAFTNVILYKALVEIYKHTDKEYILDYEWKPVFQHFSCMYRILLNFIGEKEIAIDDTLAIIFSKYFFDFEELTPIVQNINDTNEVFIELKSIHAEISKNTLAESHENKARNILQKKVTSYFFNSSSSLPDVTLTHEYSKYTEPKP